MKNNQELIANLNQLKDIDLKKLEATGESDIKFDDVGDEVDFGEFMNFDENGMCVPSFNVNDIDKMFDDDSEEDITKCSKCNASDTLTSYDFCELCDKVFCRRCDKVNKKCKKCNKLICKTCYVKKKKKGVCLDCNK